MLYVLLQIADYFHQFKIYVTRAINNSMLEDFSLLLLVCLGYSQIMFLFCFGNFYFLPFFWFAAARGGVIGRPLPIPP